MQTSHHTYYRPVAETFAQAKLRVGAAAQAAAAMQGLLPVAGPPTPAQLPSTTQAPPADEEASNISAFRNEEGRQSVTNLFVKRERKAGTPLSEPEEYSLAELLQASKLSPLAVPVIDGYRGDSRVTKSIPFRNPGGPGEKFFALFAILADEVILSFITYILGGHWMSASRIIRETIEEMSYDFKLKYNEYTTSASGRLFTHPMGDNWATNFEFDKINEEDTPVAWWIFLELMLLLDEIQTSLLECLRDGISTMWIQQFPFVFENKKGPPTICQLLPDVKGTLPGTKRTFAETVLSRVGCIGENENKAEQEALNGRLYQSALVKHTTERMLLELGLEKVGQCLAVYDQGAIPRRRRLALTALTIPSALVEAELKTLVNLPNHFGVHTLSEATARQYTLIDTRIAKHHRTTLKDIMSSNGNPTATSIALMDVVQVLDTAMAIRPSPTA